MEKEKDEEITEEEIQKQIELFREERYKYWKEKGFDDEKARTAARLGF